MKIYVFTYTSTDSLGIEDTETFSTLEKARAYMKKWNEATAYKEGDMLTVFSEDHSQVVTAKGETWTAEITETDLDEKDDPTR